MKFTPRDLGESAEASSGGGNRGMLAEFGKLLALSAAVIACIWLAFGGIAELVTRFITVEQEAAMLNILAPTFETWVPESEAEESRAAMIGDVLNRLVALPEVPPLDYRIIFVDMPEPNAFALPGGGIGITRGLLDALGDEEIAYAFIVGHELGHFKNRDHLRGLVRNVGAGAALGMLFGSSGAAHLASNAGELVGLSYSRAQEHAADDFGMTLVRQLYPDSKGADRLFVKLSEQGEPPAWAYMFFTHPDSHERIRRLREKTP